MADNYAFGLQDAMDKLWFHKNILFFEPTGISLQSVIKSMRAKAAAPPNQPPSSCSTAGLRKGSSSEILQSVADTRRRKPVTRLNIVTDQPLFQLRAPARNKRQAENLPSNMYLCSQVTNFNHRSFSETAKNEMKGPRDSGFLLQKEKLRQQSLNMVRGLRIIGEEVRGSEDEIISEEQVRRPYLHKAWLTSKPDHVLLNLHMKPKSSQPTDMKKHLRYWARKVAYLVQNESRRSLQQDC